jgi:type 1 glutamine amidotransferase
MRLEPGSNGFSLQEDGWKGTAARLKTRHGFLCAIDCGAQNPMLSMLQGDHLVTSRRWFCLSLALTSLAVILNSNLTQGQSTGIEAVPPAPHAKQIHLKHVLVVSQTKGFEHDSISPAMAAIYNMGQESGLWDTEMRTDTELLTKKDLGRNAKNLSYFDLLIFASTTGELDLDASQKADMLSFIHDDGKGFVGIHAAMDTNYNWPEYGEMIGGWFDQHPWMTFNAPIINEDPDFPAVRHFPKAFVKYDEIYQPKAWSRDKVNVLLSLDPSKLDYSNNPRIHRSDHDFAVAWSKMYGKGRVFYSTLGHTEESWQDPDVRKMYFEAIRWALGMTEGSTLSHVRPPQAQ